TFLVPSWERIQGWIKAGTERLKFLTLNLLLRHATRGKRLSFSYDGRVSDWLLYQKKAEKRKGFLSWKISFLISRSRKRRKNGVAVITRLAVWMPLHRMTQTAME
ncbi:MAG: hypothetical protein BROFUL_01936, partial [Candidatus Brocadia fulgida]